jgi:hypothetical protein
MEDIHHNGPTEVIFEESRLMLFMVIIIVPFYLAGDLIFDLVWRHREPLIQMDLPFWTKFLIVLAAIPVHELIHGLIFGLYAPNGFRSVRFGFSLSMGSPYCHCSDAVKVKHYRRAGIAPFIILGILPYLFSVFTGVSWIKVFGLLLSIGGFGDVLVWIKLLKYDKNLLIRDHPEKMGFIIVRNSL